MSWIMLTVNCVYYGSLFTCLFWPSVYVVILAICLCNTCLWCFSESKLSDSHYWGFILGVCETQKHMHHVQLMVLKSALPKGTDHYLTFAFKGTMSDKLYVHLYYPIRPYNSRGRLLCAVLGRLPPAAYRTLY